MGVGPAVWRVMRLHHTWNGRPASSQKDSLIFSMTSNPSATCHRTRTKKHPMEWLPKQESTQAPHLTKDGVFLIQAVEVLSCGDVKLGGVEVLPGRGHPDDALPFVLQVGADLVFKETSLVAI